MTRVIPVVVLVALAAACGHEQITSPSAVSPPASSNAPPSPPPGTASAGNYVVTFSSDVACQSIPEEGRIRTYRTFMSGAPAWQLLTLNGASFQGAINGYPGAGLSFNILAMTRSGSSSVRVWFQDPPVIELVANNARLTIDGAAEGGFIGDTADLVVSGVFQWCESNDAPGECATCRSTEHRLVFVKQ